MSTVSLADAQARAGADITQDQVDEAEEWLTARIGPLTGELVETFYLSRRRHRLLTVDGLWLRRNTDSVAVVNYEVSTDTSGTTLTSGTDYRLIDHLLVERNYDSATLWGQTMEVTYTPNDEDTVRSVIFDALSIRQREGGLQSVRIGQYSETYFPDSQKTVEASLLRRILPAASLGEFYDPFRYRIYHRDRTLLAGSGS